MTFSRVVVFEGTKVLRPPPTSPLPGRKPKRHKQKAGRHASHVPNVNRFSSSQPSPQYRVKQKLPLSHSEAPSPTLLNESDELTPEVNDEHSHDEEDSEEGVDSEESKEGDEEVEGEEGEEGGLEHFEEEDDEEEDEIIKEEATEKGKEVPAQQHQPAHKEVSTMKVSQPQQHEKKPAAVVPPIEKLKEGDKVIKGYRYLVEVAVGRGRAPVYFNSHGHAYFRLSGSIHQMQESMIEERKLMGRPPLSASPGVENLGRTPPKLTEDLAGSTTDAPLDSPRNATGISSSSSLACISVAHISSFCSLFTGLSLSGPSDFIGRQKEIKQVMDFIFNTHHSENNVTILLYGSPVVGKSALARHLVNELSSVYTGAHYTINMKGKKMLSFPSFFQIFLTCPN